MTQGDWWIHFVCQRQRHPPLLTIPRLARIKDVVLADEEFWNDVLIRHGGAGKMPAQLKAEDPDCYNHLLDNMVGMVCQLVLEQRS
jgi:hypothetical protein